MAWDIWSSEENCWTVPISNEAFANVGGQLESGFQLTNLIEDRDRKGESVLRDYLPTYIRTRALKEK